MEDEYPGLWHTWFREQIVAIGWPPASYGLRTSTDERAWRNARRYLLQIEPGDNVIVQLKNWRIGRIGTVLKKSIEDTDWNPSVPTQAGDSGEMGRRVQVRWDLTTGRLTPDFVVELPPKARPNPGIWRPTLSKVPHAIFETVERAIRDENNWVSLVPGFASERALSEYISASPHLLEDALVPYPSASARELRTGLKIGKNIRGILVHGGARKLSSEVRRESKRAPHIELLQFSVSVGFTPSL